MKRCLIFDGNNWFRRKAETSFKASPMRECFFELQNSPAELIFVVWDGFDARKTRREIYPEYKLNRNRPGDDFFAVQDTFKQLCELSKATLIEVPYFEADDVINEVCKKYRATYQVTVVSSDIDFRQIAGVQFTSKDPGISTQDMLLYKTLVGDPADNIKGIPGFGEKAWLSLTPSMKDMFLKLLSGNNQMDNNFWSGTFKPSVAKWLDDFSNIEKLRVYWKVINFLPVSEEQIKQNTKIGLNRDDLADGVLRQYFL